MVVKVIQGFAPVRGGVDVYPDRSARLGDVELRSTTGRLSRCFSSIPFWRRRSAGIRRRDRGQRLRGGIRSEGGPKSPSHGAYNTNMIARNRWPLLHWLTRRQMPTSSQRFPRHRRQETRGGYQYDSPFRFPGYGRWASLRFHFHNSPAGVTVFEERAFDQD